MWKNVNRIFLMAVLLMMMVVPVGAYYSIGDKGNDVMLIQQQLIKKGYRVKTNGIYTEDTARAVAKFQADRRIQISGKVGDWTFYQITGKRMKMINEDQISYQRFSSDDMGNRLVSIANKYVGVPYVWGGNTPKGFDCSGFTKYVFSNAGINLPRLADQQYMVGSPVSRSDLIPGDLVFFTTYCPGVSHSGIYVGNDKFISATSSGGIRVDSMSNGYWSSRYVGAKRVR
ncbi:MAG: NlpC/P60 family protein [Megasphaera sp.]|uniref:C40 family peptidase n=1 Tax=Megasphaera sueciensis TaxID=349094 RepID=UPI003D01722F|nr:NlpC/P60 family protein [Megasphaera sp.]MCI1822467.1 NlpC/P60 family protein [Megasphaera sp.]